MQMLTNFGKELRKLRIEHMVTLGELGDAISLSAAFISALETGKKPVPANFIEKVANELKLSQTEIQNLRLAAARQTTEVTLPLTGKSDRAKELVVAFARRFDSMSDAELKKVFGE